LSAYLDLLCDERGWEYNKLHRRFLQLLTSKRLETIPVDFVFVVSTEKPLINSLENSAAVPYRNRFLLKQLPFEERDWLKFSNKKTDKRIEEYINKILPLGEKTTAPYLKEMVSKRISVHVWLRNLIRIYLSTNTGSGSVPSGDKARRIFFLKKAFKKLELYASRHNLQKVLAEILVIYENFDLQIRKNEKSAQIFSVILHRLAFFSTPVERGVLASCPDIIELYNKHNGGSVTEKEIAAFLEEYLAELHNRGLLTKVLGGRTTKHPASSDNDDKAEYNCRYILHSLLRKHLEKKMDYSIFDSGEHTFYDVSLYMTQPRHLPKPKDSDYIYLGKTLQKLIKDSRNDLSLVFQLEKAESNLKRLKLNTKTKQTDIEDIKQKEEQLNKKIRDLEQRIKSHFNDNLDSIQSPIQRLRAAKNLIAHAFSIGVISRLGFEENGFDLIGENETHCPFENYESWTRGILNAATGITHLRKKLSGILKEPNSEDKHIRHAFYATEISWLYNERALTNFVQGRLYDALPLFELALDGIRGQKFTDDHRDFHRGPSSSYRRVLLNKALARLEFGKISEARKYFEMLSKQVTSRSTNDPSRRISLTGIIATGYLGLCDHLTSRFDTAGEYYDIALKRLEDKPHRLRTKAIFLKLQADLERTKNNIDKAEELIDESIRATISVEQQDILHHSYISKALITSHDPARLSESLEFLRRAETYAERLGIPKLTADAANIRGRIYLQNGQLDSVGKLLATSIAICNKNGMTLRKITALSTYGELLQLRNDDPDLAKRVREFSIHLAEKTGYMSRTHADWTQHDIKRGSSGSAFRLY